MSHSHVNSLGHGGNSDPLIGFQTRSQSGVFRTWLELMVSPGVERRIANSHKGSGSGCGSCKPLVQSAMAAVTIVELAAIDKANIIVMTASPPIDAQADFDAPRVKVWPLIFRSVASTALIVKLLWLGDLLDTWAAARAVSRGFRRASDATWFSCCRFWRVNRVSRLTYKA